jgi:tetratricopeptide (TPR) repeat protein
MSDIINFDSDQRIKIAHGYMEIGDFNRAIEEFNILLASELNDPKDIKFVLMGLSASYAHLKNWEKVIDLCKKEIELDPNDYSVYLRLGCAFIDNGQYEEAKKQLLRSLSINPICFDTRCHLGNLFKYQGKLKDALIEYKTAISINPSNPYVYCSISNIYIASGNLLLAKEMLLKSLNLGNTSKELNELIRIVDNELKKIT